VATPLGAFAASVITLRLTGGVEHGLEWAFSGGGTLSAAPAAAAKTPLFTQSAESQTVAPNAGAKHEPGDVTALFLASAEMAAAAAGTTAATAEHLRGTNTYQLDPYEWDSNVKLWKGTVWYTVDHDARERGIRDQLSERDMRRAVMRVMIANDIGGENATRGERWAAARDLSVGHEVNVSASAYNGLATIPDTHVNPDPNTGTDTNGGDTDNNTGDVPVVTAQSACASAAEHLVVPDVTSTSQNPPLYLTFGNTCIEMPGPPPKGETWNQIKAFWGANELPIASLAFALVAASLGEDYRQRRLGRPVEWNFGLFDNSNSGPPKPSTEAAQTVPPADPDAETVVHEEVVEEDDDETARHQGWWPPAWWRRVSRRTVRHAARRGR
jgi:hypothetical protein